MKAFEIIQLHDAFLSGKQPDNLEIRLSDISKEEQEILLERLWTLFEANESVRYSEGDWTEAQGELIMLILEQKGDERIVDFFENLSKIVNKSPSSIQFKYYKTLKKLETGISLKDALTISRGQRGKSKTTLIREQKISEDSERDLDSEFEESLTPELRDYINRKATSLAALYASQNITPQNLPDIKLFFEARNGVIEDFIDEQKKSAFAKRNLNKLTKTISNLEGFTESERQNLINQVTFLLNSAN